MSSAALVRPHFDLSPAAPGSPAADGGYSGRQRAAIVLIALGPERAAGVLGKLSDDEVELLSAEMAALSHIDPQVSESVVGDLCQQLTAGLGGHRGGLQYTRSVLEALLGEEGAARVLEMLVGPQHGRPFEFLRSTPPEQIVTFLADESPQTVAFVAAALPPDLGAEVLSGLPSDLQGDVALRIATMTETNPQVVADVEAGLRVKLSSVVQQEFANTGGVDQLAAMINQAGRSTERNVLAAVGDVDADLADAIRSKLFTFEDLATLSDRDIQRVLRDADQKDLVVALRGVSPELQERLFANMSSRGADMLREDLETGQPQRRPVVEAAQARVTALVRVLEADGAIQLGRGTSDAPEDEVI